MFFPVSQKQFTRFETIGEFTSQIMLQEAGKAGLEFASSSIYKYNSNNNNNNDNDNDNPKKQGRNY